MFTNSQIPLQCVSVPYFAVAKKATVNFKVIYVSELSLDETLFVT